MSYPCKCLFHVYLLCCNCSLQSELRFQEVDSGNRAESCWAANFPKLCCSVKIRVSRSPRVSRLLPVSSARANEHAIIVVAWWERKNISISWEVADAEKISWLVKVICSGFFQYCRFWSSNCVINCDCYTNEILRIIGSLIIYRQIAKNDFLQKSCEST